MEIFAVKIFKDIDKENFDRLAVQLDNEKRQIIGNMKNLQARLAALTSALLIRYIIKIKLGQKNEEIVFAKNKYGKPHLLMDRNFHFNLSHSGDWAVCVVDSKQIGIDIEKIDYQSPKIILEVMSTEELTIYDKLKKIEQISFFYNIWTRKESYIKALGIGLNIPLNTLTILAKNESCIFSPNINSYFDRNFFIKQFYIDNKYSISVCAHLKNFPESIVFIDSVYFLENLLNINKKAIT